MSQILDAISKAEKQRKDALEENKPTRQSLYQTLNQGKQQKPRSRMIPLTLLAVASLGGAVYSIYHSHWLASPTSEINAQGKPKIANKSAANSLTGQSDQQKTTITDTQAVAATKPSATTTSTQPASQSAGMSEIPKTTIQSKKAQQTIQIAKGKKPPKLATLTPVAQKRPSHTQQTLSQLTAIEKKPSQNAALKQPSKSAVRAKTTQKTVTKETAKRLNNQQTMPVQSTNTTAKTVATPSWKKNIRITAIMYHHDPARRFVLIKGKKIYEGSNIPGSQTSLVKILPKNIIINDGTGDVMVR